MPSNRQLPIADCMMGVGMLPLLLVGCWILAFFLTNERGQPPAIPIIDPIGMIVILLVSFLLSAVVAGGAALWSWILVVRHSELRSRRARTLRLATALLLASPFVLTSLLRLFGR